MRRIQSYIADYTIDIDVPSEGTSVDVAALISSAGKVMAANKEYLDLVDPYNPECKSLFSDYVHPAEITIDKNPLYPFVVDDEILAIQNSMPFESSLEQQSIYNGDINSEISPYLACLDGALSDPNVWGLDQSIPTEILKFAKNPPTQVNAVENLLGGNSFMTFLQKINKAEEKVTRARLEHKDNLSKIVNLQTNPMAAKVMDFANRNSQVGAMAMIKQKMALKDIFLKGASSSEWLAKLKTKIPTINLTKPNIPTVPNLTTEMSKLKL